MYIIEYEYKKPTETTYTCVWRVVEENSFRLSPHIQKYMRNFRMYLKV